MFKEVKSFEYITIAEAREIMEEIVKKRQEKVDLLFETRRTLRHLKTFSKLSADEAKKLVKELLKLPQVGKPEIAIKIADIMPKVADEVRAIYMKERTLTNEEIEQILEIVEKYRK
ncbi:MAG: RNA polymerase Rpb4 [Archaeoglobales archaeon]|jgi:DNA-directed RNA polymerase subunit F|nr:RNA polymerase Rpb4 family protein [Archaeoglobi archaeon]NHW23952.1 RNA polymerase Rpb4 [Archaeoglobales archaeon]TDA26713.1 MAG: RNA polymerase Rpb4 [Archaeoglobi archaeon]